MVDVVLNFLSPKTQLLNHTSKKMNDTSTISAKEDSFDFARMIFMFATRPKSEARNRIRIIISQRLWHNNTRGTGIPLSQYPEYQYRFGFNPWSAGYVLHSDVMSRHTRRTTIKYQLYVSFVSKRNCCSSCSCTANCLNCTATCSVAMLVL